MEQLIILITFLILSGILVLIRNIFHDTYIWQIKEYRLDRIWSHLKYKEEPSGRNLIINVLQYLFLSMNLLFFLKPTNYLLITPALIFVSYIYESWSALDEIITKKIIRPKKSIRNLLIVSLSLVTLILITLIPIHFLFNLQSQGFPLTTTKTVNFEDFLVQKDIKTNTDTIPLAILILFISSTLIIVADLISPAIVFFWAITTEPLSQIKRYLIINKAINKIKTHKGFKVIAITGSYGKSTTKELLYHILNKRFNVAKTNANFNSHVGIAQEIIKNLKDDTEIFIAEMGAYNRKDIIKSTKILKPDISIITGITTQHLSLFKTIQNLVKAKYEIIKALNKNGTAIFNGNNEYCLIMASKTKNKKYIYYVNYDEIGKVTENVVNMKDNEKKSNLIILFAFNIKNLKESNGYEFKLRYNQKVYDLKVNFVGKRNIENLLGAISASLEIGMDIKDIVAKINTTQFKLIHLKWFDGINNSLVLDDSYNSNQEGFIQALDLLNEKQTQKKRILVTKGMIELGKKKKEIYKKLAKEVIKKTDLIITSDKDLAKSIKNEKNDFPIIYEKNPRNFVIYLEQKIHEDDVVLLEGALPSIVRMKAIDTN